MNNKPKQNINENIMFTDSLIRITALETLLITKGIFTQEELAQLNYELTSKIVKKVLEQANIKDMNVDDMVKKVMDDK